MNKTLLIILISCLSIICNAQKGYETAVFFDANTGEEIFTFQCDFITDMYDDFAIYSIYSEAWETYQKGVLNMATQEVVINNSDGILDINFYYKNIVEIEYSDGSRRFFDCKLDKTVEAVPSISKPIIPQSLRDNYKSVSFYDDNLYRVTNENGQQGIVNHRGKVIIPIVYKNIETVNDNVIFVTDENRKGYFYNHKGKLLSKETFTYFDNFFTDNIIGFRGDKKPIVFNKKFKPMKMPNDDYVTGTMGNFYIFGKRNLGIKDFDGNVILEAEYSEILPMHNDVWAVKKNGNQAIFNPNTKEFLTDFNLYNIASSVAFSEELLALQHFIPNDNNELYGSYHKGHFYEPRFQRAIFANEKYFCGIESPYYKYRFPKVEFKYAISYQYNIGEKARKDVAFENIYDKDGNLAQSATKIKRLTKADLTKVNRLFVPIVRENEPTLPTSYCYIPRDAIIFYDENDKVVATLEVCFECSKVICSEGLRFPGTKGNWQLISELFKDLGHKK